jgi:hypothetical protein
VERSTDGFNFAQVASLGANVTSFTNSGLSAGTTYAYRVRASNGGGFSGYSNTGTASTTATTPGAPTNPTPGTGAVNVNVDADLGWTCSGATSYDVYYGTGSNPAFYRTVTSPSLALGRMTAGVTYYWRVVAKNGTSSVSGATWRFTTKSRTAKYRAH